MWTTVMLLAIAANFEPTRIGLLPLLLSRPRPLMQLAFFLVGGLTVNLGFGFVVLFTLHRNPFGSSPSNGGKAQIIVGVMAVMAALAMALRAIRSQRRVSAVQDSQSPYSSSADANPRGVDRLIQSVRSILSRGRSPWLAGLIGAGVGLPSVDYLAVLMIIATSGASQPQQAAVLISSAFAGSLVMIAPLIGYLIAPARTLEIIDRFGAWTRSRSQFEYAALLAFAGVMLIGIGWGHL